MPAHDEPSTLTALVPVAAIERIAADPSLVRPVVQPIVDVRRGAVAGYEARAHFRDEVVAPPDVWFATARAHGLGARFAAAVLSPVLELQAVLPPDCFLSVRVAPGHLGEPNVLDLLLSHPLDGLVVDLTEPAPLEGLASLSVATTRLRERGALIAVEEAGAGYAGLQQIVALRPDLVKLDRTLVNGIEDDDAKRALVQMLHDFAGRREARLLAEGIVRVGELDALVRLGVPLLQGDLLARPGAPWPSIEPAAQAALRSRRADLQQRGTIRTIVEHADVSTDVIVGERVTVELDDRDRPVSFGLPRSMGGKRRQRHQMMLVKLDELIADVMRRALTRPQRYRYDPVVCCDDAGTFVGVVHLDRLVLGAGAPHAVG